MKKVLFLSLVLSLLSVNCVFASSHIYVNAINVFDRTRYSTVSSYNCNFTGVQCIVSKVKMLQTGKTMYDSDCSGDNFEQGRFKNRAVSDVRLNRFDYCELSSKDVTY